MTYQIQARRTVYQEPFYVQAENIPDTVQSAVTTDGRRFPAQKTANGFVVIADAARGVPVTFTLSDEPTAGGVTFTPADGESALEVRIGDQLFTRYVYSDAFLKPFLGPVMASTGVPFTRLDLETKEHPHQRSVFVAVGDVNGVDFWNEYGTYGRERAGAPTEIVSGAAYGAFTAHNVWESLDGQPFVDEQRTFTFYNQSAACRTVDLTVTFTASYGDVQFGPTKEAGPLGIRVNESLRADRGGQFRNAYGAENEDECWGRPAPWCDYAGVIDGRRYGIAAFDHEDNERYPTTWHIRNYGLFAANNLYFKGGLTIPAGQTLTYRFRLCFYENELDTAAKFLQWAK